MQFLRYLCLISVFLCCQFVLATSVSSNTLNKPVHILTWWDYFNKPWVAKYLFKKCGINVTYDEYYSNEEFQHRWEVHKKSYDIIIFEDTFYKQIENDLKDKGSNLSKITKDYYPYIKKNFIRQNYLKNILYLSQSVTGILWNPKLIKISKNTPISKMISDSLGNSVVLLDDPRIVSFLFSSGFDKKIQFNITDFNLITKNVKLYIANDYNKIYESPGFAFSYTWSGEALTNGIKSGNKYLFTLSPNISYISSDLIAQVSSSSKSTCIARAIGSREFLSNLQNDTMYFSPYADTHQLKSPSFKKLYKEYLHELKYLKWMDTVTDQVYESSVKIWKFIKLQGMT